MDKVLPDKWIRKAVFDTVNNIVVDSNTIPCYDTYVSGEDNEDFYILMTTQTSEMRNDNKCEDQWISSVLLDIVTRYNGNGNVGSRLLADNIADEVRRLTYNLSLDAGSGLSIVWQRQDFEPDISTITRNQNVFRKLLRIEMLVN